jgi:flagellar motility protein MotE (MotC chaperone)
MIRKLSLIFACVCVTVVLVEAAAMVVFWRQGWLSAHYWREVRMVFENRQIEDNTMVRETEETTRVSQEDVLKTRALKVLDLEKREGDLEVLRQNVLARAEQLAQDESALKTKQDAFRGEMESLRKQMADAAIEQARQVLLALPPPEAALKLTQVAEDEAIRLLKGLPEKSIAKILKEFTGSPEQIERSKRLFEALLKGEPEVTAIDAARQGS